LKRRLASAGLTVAPTPLTPLTKACGVAKRLTLEL
jgi:hypothetical protein